MNRQFFKLLFGALFLVAATAFTGCSDDDNAAAPELTVSSETLFFTDETETTQTLQITANCEWRVVKTDLDWATVEPASGRGNATLSVSVQELPVGTTNRSGEITFSLTHPEFGPWGSAEQKIAVNQYGQGVTPPPTSEALYTENAGTATFKKADYNGNWPYVDKYDKWTKGGTLDQSGVEYGGSSSSVRCSGDDYEPNAADNISGAPYVTVKTFEIKNINIASNRNFTFTFVAQNTVSTLSASPFTPTFGDITSSSFNFSVSMDGANFAKVAFVPVKSNSSWYKCTAEFKLPASATTSTIAIRMDGFSGGTTLRVDDLNLYEGGNGAELDFSDTPGPGPGENATIAQVIAGEVGSTFTTQGQIVAVNGRSFLIQDATGRMLVYQGWNNDTKKPVYEYAATIGQTVKVTGKTTTYSKLVQFSEEGLSVEKVSDGTFTQPTPEKFDGAAFDAYKAATPVIKYIEYTGTLTISGFYYNIAVEGTTLQGSLAYPADGFVDASLDKQSVTVKGYTLGMTNSASMLSTIAVSVVKTGEDPGPGPDPTLTAIGNITEAGEYETEGTVVARGKMAYIIADNTGAMMVYHRDNERTVGEKIKIAGAVTVYNATSTPQFSDAATVEVLSTGNSWSYSPTAMDAAAMDALLEASPVCKEVQFEGLLEIDGNYANVTIAGASKAIGSIKYLDNTTISSLNGMNIVVKGYFVGTSSGKFINVLPYSVEESGTPVAPKISSVSPESLSFAAAGEAKEVNVTLNSAAQGLALEASADNAQFTATVDGTKVTVTAAENATEAAITGTLTISLMQNGAAVDTKTVALSQAGKSSGNEQTVTISFAGGDGQNHDEIAFTEGAISAVFGPGTHSTKPRWDAAFVRFYGTKDVHNTLTVSGATITKVEFKFNGSYTMAGMTADSGSMSETDWTGSSNTIVFTAGAAQTRIEGITVTYAQ